MTRLGFREGTLHAFLSRDWAGLAIALFVSALGLMTFTAGNHWSTDLLGGLALASGSVLTSGSLFHMYRLRRSMNRLPAPGRMVSVGRFQMHILAEGDSGNNVPVIWIAGGHGQGLLMHHLHRRMCNETRSILFDRAGSGWSEAGPFPRTIPREADELSRLLDGAGEYGPFLMIGHSFGGLFATNFAHIHPERVAGLLLLDPTPPWNLTYAGNLSFSPIRSAAWKAALRCLFGLGWSRKAMDREAVELDATKEFAGMEEEIRLEHARARTHLSSSSALWTASRSPFDLVIGKDALGDMPLLEVIAPTDHADLENQLASQLGFSERQIGNLLDGLALSPQEQLRLSSRSRLVHAPDGTSHMFPYEDPEFVIGLVREMMKSIRPGP